MQPIALWQKRKMFALAGKQKIDNEALHDFVFTATGKESIRDLTMQEANQILAALEPEENGTGATARQRTYIQRLAHQVGITSAKKLDNFLFSYYGVSVLTLFDKTTAGKAIEGLKAIKNKRERKEGNGMKKVHLNAGHGGKDAGASGNGVVEKETALRFALQTGEYLSQRGFKVSYTRTADEYVTLGEIARKANAEQADLFLSFHHNAAENTAASGIETLLHSKQDIFTVKAAEKIQKGLVEACGMRDRGIKERPDLVVLNSTKMPAVLIELGFVSNAADAALLKQPAFLDKAAKAVCGAVCRLYDVPAAEKEKEFISIEQQEAPKWQTDGLDTLVKNGVIKDREYWEDRIFDPVTIGELVGLLANTVGGSK